MIVCHEQPVAADTNSKNMVALMTTRSARTYTFISCLCYLACSSTGEFIPHIHCSPTGSGHPVHRQTSPTARRWQQRSISLLQTHHLLCRRGGRGFKVSPDCLKKVFFSVRSKLRGCGVLDISRFSHQGCHLRPASIRGHLRVPQGWEKHQ